MPKKIETFPVGGIKGGRNVRVQFDEFVNVEEALQKLGDDTVLKYINYAHKIYEMSKARRRFYETNPGPNSDDPKSWRGKHGA